MISSAFGANKRVHNKRTVLLNDRKTHM